MFGRSMHGMLGVRAATTLLAMIGLGTGLAGPSHGIVVVNSEPLTQPPEYGVDAQGWHATGTWNNFAATAISPNHIITARHTGGSLAEDVFILDGVEYTAIARHLAPNNADLSIWEIDPSQTIETYVPIYDGPSPVGESAVLIGSGRRKADPVRADGMAWDGGWELVRGSSGTMTWGTNQVDAIVTDNRGNEFLAFDFDFGTSYEEGIPVLGDSGGGAFVILPNGSYALAGVHVSALFQFSRDPEGTDLVDAALYDIRGLYVQSNSGWQYIDPNEPAPVPALAYSISTTFHADWIQSVIESQSGSGQSGSGDGDGTLTPEPGSAIGLIIGAVGLMLGARLRRRSQARRRTADPV